MLGNKPIDAELLEELESQLIMADVGIEATSKVMNALNRQVVRSEVGDSDALKNALTHELTQLLLPVEQPLEIPQSDSPFVILVVGVNGSGKTTTIGKLAKQLQEGGKSVMLAAGDTFRAAAVEQLQTWGEDTAGRLHTQSNLMDELRKVKRVIGKVDPLAPHETLIVLDGGTGQNALNQAMQFHEAMDLTGMVVTKLDGTAKGGVIFAIAEKLSLPIRFIGVGEQVADLEVFEAERYVGALLSGE